MHATPHDKLFKAVFGRVDNAVALLCSVLPAAVVQSLDVTTVTPAPTSFVDHKLRERLSDLLYIVQPTPDELPLYLLLEHKSSPEVLTAFTATRYSVDVLTGWVRDNRRTTRTTGALPAIVPVVVHHGAGGWTAGRALHDLYSGPSGVLDALGEHLLGGRLLVYDVAIESDAQLRGRGMNPLATLALWALARARNSSDIVNDLARVADLMQQVATRPDGTEALATILRYLMDVCDASFEALDDFLDHHLGPSAQETYMTLAERIRQEERQRMEAVIAQECKRTEQEVVARERKRTEAVIAQERRALLYDLLGARGLPVSASVRARIEACDSADRLATWLRRSVTASSVEQLLHDDEQPSSRRGDQDDTR